MSGVTVQPTEQVVMTLRRLLHDVDASGTPVCAEVDLAEYLVNQAHGILVSLECYLGERRARALWAATTSRERQQAEKKILRYEDALEQIAAPVRPDGTYNLSREACEEIAREALS